MKHRFWILWILLLGVKINPFNPLHNLTINSITSAAWIAWSSTDRLVCSNGLMGFGQFLELLVDCLVWHMIFRKSFNSLSMPFATKALITSNHGASESVGSLHSCSCMVPCHIYFVITAGKLEHADRDRATIGPRMKQFQWQGSLKLPTANCDSWSRMHLHCICHIEVWA